MRYNTAAKIIGLSVIICLAIITTATAQTAPAPTLESLKTAYTNAVAKITADTQKQKDDALVQYGKNLVTVQVSLKQKGDIDGYMVVDQEVKRFQTEKKVLVVVPIACTDFSSAR